MFLYLVALANGFMTFREMIDRFKDKPRSVSYPYDTGDETYEQRLMRKSKSAPVEGGDFKPIDPVKGYKPVGKGGLKLTSN